MGQGTLFEDCPLLQFELGEGFRAIWLHMNEIFSIVSLTDPKFNISGYFKYLSTISW
jgi:hypothetical protein